MSSLKESLQAYGEAGWQAREALWQKRRAYPEAREALTGEERELFTFLAGTLPATDLGDYPPALLLSAVQEALAARQAFPWCAALPDPLFLLYVLCPRVNNEALAPCREHFQAQLAPRVQGLPLPEVILAVNRWCGEQVTYRTTDSRTSSAWDIYSRGWGRCGEESVFAVNALRSVGIAARQVYAPWWSHCDDNHAWVEAWDGSAWRFLGACEPEPALDRGWFVPAAGRAMLCHAKAFVGQGEGWQELFFSSASPLDLDRREGVAYESVTSRYAAVQPFRFTVLDPAGQPVSGAQIQLSLLNEGSLGEIARRTTNSQGQASLHLGLGSLWVTVWQGDQRAEALVHTGETDQLTITLPGSSIQEGSFDFFAPEDGGRVNPPLSPEEKLRRRQVLEQGEKLRSSRPVQNPCHPPEYQQVWETLTDKDRAGDIPLPVLEESQGVLSKAESFPSPVFRQALLCPRVDTEPLAPWRERLQGAVFPGPEGLWNWLQENLPAIESFSDLPQTPGGAWGLGAAHEPGRRVLFCALCRAQGIPARLGADGSPEFWQDGAFHRADGLPLGQVTVSWPEEETGKLSLLRWAEGWRPVIGFANGESLGLGAGFYRLLTATRLPGGSQLGKVKDFHLSPGESLAITAAFRQADSQQLLQRLPLPELGFTPQDLELLCWLEPGEEPTEHLLNELAPVARRLEALGCGLTFFAPAPWQPGGELQKASLRPWDGDLAEAAARRLYREPGRMPLVVLAQGGQARFTCAGYNVGLGELTVALAEALGKEEKHSAAHP